MKSWFFSWSGFNECMIFQYCSSNRCELVNKSWKGEKNLFGYLNTNNTLNKEKGKTNYTNIENTKKIISTNNQYNFFEKPRQILGKIYIFERKGFTRNLSKSLKPKGTIVISITDQNFLILLWLTSYLSNLGNTGLYDKHSSHLYAHSVVIIQIPFTPVYAKDEGDGEMRLHQISLCPCTPKLYRKILFQLRSFRIFFLGGSKLKKQLLRLFQLRSGWWAIVSPEDGIRLVVSANFQFSRQYL